MLCTSDYTMLIHRLID